MIESIIGIPTTKTISLISEITYSLEKERHQNGAQNPTPHCESHVSRTLCEWFGERSHFMGRTRRDSPARTANELTICSYHQKNPPPVALHCKTFLAQMAQTRDSMLVDFALMIRMKKTAAQIRDCVERKYMYVLISSEKRRRRHGNACDMLAIECVVWQPTITIIFPCNRIIYKQLGC